LSSQALFHQGDTFDLGIDFVADLYLQEVNGAAGNARQEVLPADLAAHQ
jgi:hypothetical protein